MDNNHSDAGSWIFTVIMLFVFPPAGIFLLFRQLMGYGSGDKSASYRQHPYDIQQEQAKRDQHNYQYNYQYEYHYDKDDLQKSRPTQTTKVTQTGKPARSKIKMKANAAQLNLKRGKMMTVAGGLAAAIFGLTSASVFLTGIAWGGMAYNLPGMIWLLGFFVAGLVVMYAGLSRTKKGKRFPRYLALIGKQESVSVETLAKTMGQPLRKVYDDLEEMLERGLLPTGYLDWANGLLVLSDEGVKEPPKPQPKTADQEAEEDSAILREIREVNDAIPDPTMSQKIDRIGEITGKILDYQRKNPGKDSELRSFLDYYLPTTLKILRAYAQLDAQGIQGENISSAKERIEGMMDKVVEGFEKQLDKLFQSETLDIASDVKVLEQMLQKDGLSGGEGITLEL